MKAQGQLRLFQLVCIAFAVLLILIAIDLPSRHFVREHEIVGLIIDFCALYSATMSFAIQRAMARAEDQPKDSARKSTPLKRWTTGHLIRLTSASAVCVFAFVLQLVGGMAWEVFAFFGLGVFLLLLWTPGESPEKIGAQRAPSPITPLKAGSSTARSAARSSEERRSRAG